MLNFEFLYLIPVHVNESLNEIRQSRRSGCLVKIHLNFILNDENINGILTQPLWLNHQFKYPDFTINRWYQKGIYYVKETHKN